MGGEDKALLFPLPSTAISDLDCFTQFQLCKSVQWLICFLISLDRSTCLVQAHLAPVQPTHLSQSAAEH